MKPETPPASAPGPPPRRIRLDELLHEAREILIVHGAQTYRLRITRNGKLILTK